MRILGRGSESYAVPGSRGLQPWRNVLTRKMRVSMALLEATRVTKRFGSLVAVNRVDVCIEPGTIHAIIGPNGAGKTTFFNCITGVQRHDEGSITFKGRLLDGVKAHERAALGISRTFQNIRLFPQMTVLENVMVGRHCRTHAGLLRMFFRLRQLRKSVTFGIAPRTCWHLLGWNSGGILSPPIYLLASNAVWRSPAPWPQSRTCCSWMSQHRG